MNMSLAGSSGQEKHLAFKAVTVLFVTMNECSFIMLLLFPLLCERQKLMK